MEALSLYLHIPFCVKRCTYCDFNTYAGMGTWIPAYLAALKDEMRAAASICGEKPDVHTIFFGGGTPSVLTAQQIRDLLEAADAYFSVREDAEITLEANPGTVDRVGLLEMRKAGVNRLSFGVQSANPEELRVLGRIHSPLDAIRAVADARTAGFDNLNLDMIFALPGQTIESWARNLEFALRLRVEHLSLYSLIVEPDTPMFDWAGRGLLDLPDDDRAADMVEQAMEMLAREGYLHYEISNWARSAQLSSRHNLQYWRNRPYLGLGAGAHGYCLGQRTANVRAIPEYIRRVRGGPASGFPAAETVTPVNREDEIKETMMVGLRLVEEGVGEADFRYRFGIELDQHYRKPIERFLQIGLLQWSGDAPQRRLHLTKRGVLLGNRVFAEFV